MNFIRTEDNTVKKAMQISSSKASIKQYYSAESMVLANWENYYHGVNISDLKALKQELSVLLEEDANALVKHLLRTCHISCNHNVIMFVKFTVFNIRYSNRSILVIWLKCLLTKNQVNKLLNGQISLQISLTD